MAERVCVWNSSNDYNDDSLPDILWEAPGPRILAEIIPHFTQCFLILSMSFERYILVCRANHVEAILSTKKRTVFYSIVTLVLLAVPVFCFFAYRHYFTHADDFDDYSTSFSDIWAVRTTELISRSRNFLKFCKKNLQIFCKNGCKNLQKIWMINRKICKILRVLLQKFGKICEDFESFCS